jgi:hypothetical protein
MKTLLISLLSSILLFYGKDSFCQEESNFKNTSVKFFINGHWENEFGISPNQIYPGGTSYYDDKFFEIGYLSIAIETNQDKSLRHEFEIMPIRLNSTYNFEYIQRDNSLTTIYGGNGRTTRLESSLNYQLKYCFRVDKDIVPMIGISSQLFYNLYKNEPELSNQYPVTKNRIGIRFSIVPGLLIKISDRLAIDINMPFTFNNSCIELLNIDNPNITAIDKKSTDLFSELLPRYYSGRIGVSYKFN